MPEWLTNGAFLLAWLLGIFLIGWTVVKGANGGGSAKLKVLGIDLHVSGRAALQTVLGATLIVLPLIVANVVKAQVVPQQPSVRTVDRINDPDHAGFAFARDISVLDLRGSTAQPLLKHLNFLTKAKTNPATLLNTMTIRKLRPLDTISFTYATSGKLSARCLTHPCELRRAMQVDEHAAGVLKETWELTARIADIAVGQEFTLITEVTYWDAFDGPAKQWYASYANAQQEDESVAITLLLPEKRPLSRYDLLQYPHGSQQAQRANGTMRVITGSQGDTLYWEVFHAQSNDTYEIHWEY